MGKRETIERYILNMVEAIRSGDYSEITKDFNGELLAAFPREKAEAFFDGFKKEFGNIERCGPIRFYHSQLGIVAIHFEKRTWDFRMLLDKEDRAAGFWVLPHKEEAPVVEEHTTDLTLPFTGTWFVCQGGDTRELNHHHDDPSQKFALDMVILDDKGSTYNGDVRRCESYHAFGKDILAPADGIVVEVIDGVKDSEPMFMVPYMALGNAVFLQHKENEVSMMAHFKLQSIKVRAGDAVKRGDFLGQCGNSGNSWEPHIHFQLMNGPSMVHAKGIRPYFKDVVLTKGTISEVKDRYSPSKGDRLSPR